MDDELTEVYLGRNVFEARAVVDRLTSLGIRAELLEPGVESLASDMSASRKLLVRSEDVAQVEGIRHLYAFWPHRASEMIMSVISSKRC